MMISQSTHILTRQMTCHDITRFLHSFRSVAIGLPILIRKSVIREVFPLFLLQTHVHKIIEGIFTRTDNIEKNEYNKID